MSTLEARGFPGPPSGRFVLVSLYVLLIAATAIARFPGLNPASLWWDDLWVGTLAKASLCEALTVPNPSPPGFLFVLWILRRLVPSPEWSLQLFPFLCGLAVIQVSCPRKGRRAIGQRRVDVCLRAGQGFDRLQVAALNRVHQS